MSFPKDFKWGVATASYQIEGSALRAGGGKSVWDMFCEREGAIKNGESGWVACDHYNRYREDVALMAELGAGAYRFSLSWPRILPEGVGRVNEEGLAFYDRLVDTLLGAGIEPWVTLFHWDYPYTLFNRGGWLNPDSSQWFADYTQIVVDRLSDRVRHWMTLNEPQCFIGLGHANGFHAPGEKMQMSQVLLAGHNALLSHGRAVQVIRAGSKKADPVIGWAPVGVMFTPADENNPADIAAAKEHSFSITSGANVWNTTWWCDPVIFGRYPEDGLLAYGKAAPTPAAGDLETIAQPIDFFGTNIYHAQPIKAGLDGKPMAVNLSQGTGRTAFDWPVTPSALHWGARFFHERYGKPIVITENGMANSDWIHRDGKVHDPQRIDLIARYAGGLKTAHEQHNVPVWGYFCWSFMDNFEWQSGYEPRFGLTYVDYQTQQRIPKDSFYWYRNVIQTNGEEL